MYTCFTFLNKHIIVEPLLLSLLTYTVMWLKILNNTMTISSYLNNIVLASRPNPIYKNKLIMTNSGIEYWYIRVYPWLCLCY